MFQKLARAVIICASLILVVSRTVFSAHPAMIRPAMPSPARGADTTCIVGQLPARRA